MNKKIKIKQIDDTIKLGIKIGNLLQPGMMITLNGDLGAGKTTFTKGIGQALQIHRVINSPTFTILKQYHGKYHLSHFDAYRLEGQNDDLGFEEIFDSDDICVIEWPEFIEDILPEKRLDITIKRIDDNEREFILQPIGKLYEDLVGEL
ncbi:MAG: tRNA (adenosine(37)-N6)-threonylcarbamoyltransferase complex ATPase subunit type 1 TsaE [Faecalibacillus sp.]